MEPEHRLECSEVWGGNRRADTPVALPGLTGHVYARPTGGLRGGDVHFLSACGSGSLARVCVADVTGHGPAVSEVGRWMHRTMRRYMHTSNPARVFVELNRQATRQGLHTMTTATCLSYNAREGAMLHCSAGHPPILLARRDRTVWDQLATGNAAAGMRNLPLGVETDVVYDVARLPLQAGDRLVVYSDGVLEAPARGRDRFGLHGLVSVLEEGRHAPPAEAIVAVLDALRSPDGQVPSHDDVTLIVLDVGPPLRAPKLWLLLRNQSRRLARRLGFGPRHAA